MKKFYEFVLKENLEKTSLDKEIEKLLNDHINAELYSEYLYLSAYSFFKDKNLNGLSKWLLDHTKEERGHALKLIDYLHDRLAKVEYRKIETPKQNWNSASQVFLDIFEHEKKVSEMFRKNGQIVKKKNDEMTWTLYQEFIKEQIEEESITQEIALKLKEAGNDYSALLLIDKEYGK